jgi:hypothetical protein
MNPKTFAGANRSRIAELLPRVRDIDALNRLVGTLCDVLETTLPVPPAPAEEAIVMPALTPQEFLFSTLLDGPQPATAVERIARERHGWSPQILFKARQRLHVKAMRRRFGPGGHWFWKLPGHMTDKDDVHFHPGEWRGFIAGHQDRPSTAG